VIWFENKGIRNENQLVFRVKITGDTAIDPDKKIYENMIGWKEDLRSESLMVLTGKSRKSRICRVATSVVDKSI
jgi:hypothetical protein